MAFTKAVPGKAIVTRRKSLGAASGIARSGPTAEVGRVDSAVGTTSIRLNRAGNVAAIGATSATPAASLDGSNAPRAA